MSFDAEDRRYMRLALRLAARGLGNVWPNPAVGCVIVADGRIVGRGWTQPFGRPHAEAEALARAGAAARGATAYVTLEPCSHYGRTPPCAGRLIEAGVARVVSALEDPDPRVSGRGHEMLRAAGLIVETGCEAEAAADLQRGFLLRQTEGRPMVTLKLASSLDGRIATETGESQWITGPAARTHVHVLRARHDAVMVGGRTARHDRPSLNVRSFLPLRQPARVIVSRGDAPDLPPEGPEFGPLMVVGGAWPHIMSELAANGLTRVFCEGGGEVAAGLLRTGYVDELVWYGAGLCLGAEGLPALGPLGVTRLGDATRFELAEARQIGPDLYQRWRRIAPRNGF